jgi:hypothetical protein
LPTPVSRSSGGGAGTAGVVFSGTTDGAPESAAPYFQAPITIAVRAAMPSRAKSSTLRSIDRSCRVRGDDMRRAGTSSTPSETKRELYSST